MKGNIIGMLDGERTIITQTVDNSIVAEGITFFMIARDILWDGIKVIEGHLILPSQGFKVQGCGYAISVNFSCLPIDVFNVWNLVRKFIIFTQFPKHNR